MRCLSANLRSDHEQFRRTQAGSKDSSNRRAQARARLVDRSRATLDSEGVGGVAQNRETSQEDLNPVYDDQELVENR